MVVLFLTVIVSSSVLLPITDLKVNADTNVFSQSKVSNNNDINSTNNLSSDTNNNVTQQDYNNAEDGIVSALDFLYNSDGVKFDNDGNISYIDLNVFKNKFGNTTQIQEIEQAVKESEQEQQDALLLRMGGMDVFSSCIKRKILSFLGISEIQMLFNGQAVAFLHGHHFRRFATFILKRAENKLSKKAYKLFVKYIASKFVPGWPEISIGIDLLECTAKVVF